MRPLLTPASNLLSTMIALLITSMLVACNQQQINPIDPAADANLYVAAPRQSFDPKATLKSVATFPIGVSLDPKLLENAKINSLVANEFNSRTVPVFMNIQSAPGTFNFAIMDARMNATDSQALRLHGHCLVYHMAAPDWLLKFNGSSNDFEKAIKNHVQTLVGRYKGKVKSWDVINEIFDNNGGLRQTEFRKMYKTEGDYMTFVKRCFQWAHEADPSALLIYNDYGYESYPAKLQAALRLVADFKQSGVPIHGLGTQMHITINTPEVNIKNSLKTLSNTGLQIHVSELDIAVNTQNDPGFIFSKEVQNQQRAKYQAVATLYRFTVSRQQQYGITMWSLGDADSWLVTQRNQREMPTIFDGQYDKKPAFYGLMEGLMN